MKAPTPELIAGAREYVELQISTMKKFGMLSNVPQGKVDQMVCDIVKIVQKAKRE